MPLIYNGTTVQDIVYNGVNLDEVYYGSTLVWQKPLVYNGSAFGGALKNGIISGPQVSMNDGYSVLKIDQANNGATYQSGAISRTTNFTYTTGTGVVSGIHAGFVSVDPINLANISSISISQTCHWWVRDIQTSTPDWTYVCLDTIYYCTKSGNKYVSQGSVSTNAIRMFDTGSNGYNDTTATASANLSSVTGSYYLYFGFTGWCEVSGKTVSSTINSITFA